MTTSAWIYRPADGPPLTLGEYNDGSGHDEVALLHMTDDREQAQRWARDLRAARIPARAEAGERPDHLPPF